MSRVRWRWTAVFAYMAVIFVLSSIPRTPSLPGHTDKYLHGMLYAGLGAVIMRGLAGGWTRRMNWGMVIVATVVACLYGVSDEFHQSFVPGRQPDAGDIVADTIGALVAALTCLGWSRRRQSGAVSGPV